MGEAYWYRNEVLRKVENEKGSDDAYMKAVVSDVEEYGLKLSLMYESYEGIEFMCEFIKRHNGFLEGERKERILSLLAEYEEQVGYFDIVKIVKSSILQE